MRKRKSTDLAVLPYSDQPSANETKMITTLILLCLAMLDFQRIPIPDSMEKQFVVTELSEHSTTGCATLPHSGRPSNHRIFIDVVNNGDPHEGATTISGISATNYHAGAMETPVVPAMKVYDPPGKPEPNPDPPPVATVPEPPTVAILTITGIVLLYLLFGRQRKQKLYRRT
jgi:hypothetical protein